MEMEGPAARRARGALGIGGVLLLCGLAMVGIGPSDMGMGVTLAGLVVTIFGIHTFGRLGPDAAPGAQDAEAGAPPRRRKKKKKAKTEDG